MESTLTYKEAWADFCRWIESRRGSGEIAAIPKDVQEAKYADAARRRYGLGDRRIKSLLTKHAPDRYRFEERIILIEP